MIRPLPARTAQVRVGGGRSPGCAPVGARGTGPDGVDVARWREQLRERLGGRRDRDTGDAGVTLLELMVAMGITTVFLGMFTAAVLMISRTSQRAEAVTGGGQDIATAFQRLDRSVRYAAEVTAPGQANGSWWVEYLTNTNTGKTCTQLSLNPGAQQLRSRTWTPVAPPSTPTPSGWTTLAGRISNGSATGVSAPFIRPTPTAASAIGYQQLTVQLVSTVGNPPLDSRSTTTFTALNSAAAAKALATGTEPATCTQVARS